MLKPGFVFMEISVQRKLVPEEHGQNVVSLSTMIFAQFPSISTFARSPPIESSGTHPLGTASSVAQWLRRPAVIYGDRKIDSSILSGGVQFFLRRPICFHLFGGCILEKGGFGEMFTGERFDLLRANGLIANASPKPCLRPANDQPTT
jgi:hypothetical protein